MAHLSFGNHDIKAYFQAHGASLECPFCHRQDWGIETMDAIDNPSVTETFVYKILGSTHSLGKWRPRPVLLLTCAGCGFIRMQDARRIVRWNKNEAEAE